MMMEGAVGDDLPFSGFTRVCSQTVDSEEGGQVGLKVGIRCLMVVVRVFLIGRLAPDSARVLVLVLSRLLMLSPEAGQIRDLCFSRWRSLHVRRCELHID